MIVVTGAAGFIGSCLVGYLNQKGIDHIIMVDQFDRPNKQANLSNCQYHQAIDRKLFIEWFEQHASTVELVLHLGARTDTAEKNTAVFDALNLQYSQSLSRLCSRHQIPFVYASSAATYGLGEQGYNDQIAPSLLQPLNPYGHSKNNFDQWLLAQEEQPPFWAGLKFFNVYGPNEYHKGRMASVIWHSFQQISQTNSMKLFRSHRPDVQDGQQSRDFIYIKDLLSVIDFLIEKRPASGLYNVGTGIARSFYDLASQTFLAMGKSPQISFIDTPIDIRDTYQYYTQADISTLQAAGYSKAFYSLEEGIKDYVQNYLIPQAYYSSVC